MKCKMLIIGPLPSPITGCSYANETLCRNARTKGITFQTINTSTENISSKQGTKFSFTKVISFINTYFEAYKITSAQSVYITPGQTFWGLVKYAPFFIICILLNKPYIIHVHGNYLGKEYNRLKSVKAKIFRYLVSHASVGIVLSESLRENFSKLLPEKQIFVVENFVDDKLLQSYLEQTKNSDKLRILYLSNLMEEKGILELLEALLILKKMAVDFHAQLAGKIENNIKATINEKLQLLGNNVEYVGVVKGLEKQKIFLENNVFVLPTYYQMEGQPISILEALATGNIVVTTAHAGIPDIMTKQNGYFIKPKSSEAIVKVLELISKNITIEVKQYSNFNASYAKQRFTEEQFSRKIFSIMTDVINKKII